MTGLNQYSVVESLLDGERVEIRALRPDDREALHATISRASPQSLYRRFFAVKRNFTEREIDFFVNVDFVSHVALVAVVDQSGVAVIVGGGRYVLLSPDTAELAFAVIDHYQGRGLGSALMRHLVAIARASGLKRLVADVLPDNRPMLRVFEKIGGHATRNGDVERIELHLSAAHIA